MKYYHNIDYGNGSSFYGEELLPLNRPIWGFAYDVNDDTERKRLNSLPVLGEVVKNTYRLWDNHAFVPYKKALERSANLVLSDFKRECMQIHMKKQSKCTMS